MTKDDLQQIRDLLAEQDTRLDAKLADQDARFMTQIAPLQQDMADVKAEVHAIYDTMDGLAKRIHDDDDERAMMNSQLNRHEGYFTQLANATNVKLLPEQ
jgi:septal ring factor EnvC (AmiA/AmiB activator)